MRSSLAWLPTSLRAPRPFVAGAVAAAGVTLVACASAPPPATQAPPPPAAPVVATAPEAVDAGPPPVDPLPAGVPDTVAGHQLAWVLASFARPLTAADVTAHFAPGFLAEIPVDKVLAIFGHLGPELAPLVVDRVLPGADASSLAAVVHSGKPGAPADARLRVSLNVEPGPPSRMTMLLVRPMVEAPTASSWSQVTDAVHAVAPQVGLLAAAIDGGKCTPIASIDPKKPLALGSAFKLYVLHALAMQIAAGKHAWTDTVPLDDAHKSLPSGELQNEPAGKSFTVRELAERMIAVSDNTATDHLLAFLGRKAVEDAVKASGHATPARLVPFLSTRELFALKLTGTAAELDAYVRADVAHKRKMLDDFGARDLSKVPTEDNGWNKPRKIDSIEWLASPEDLCKLMAALKGYADAPATAPVGAILALNPGIPDDNGLFQYIGFKGGSEPGVLDMTWLLARKTAPAAGPAAAKWLFLTVDFNDPNTVIDEQKGVAAATMARDVLGK